MSRDSFPGGLASIFCRMPSVQVIRPILKHCTDFVIMIGQARKRSRKQHEVGNRRVISLVVAGPRPNVAGLEPKQIGSRNPKRTFDGDIGVVVIVEYDGTDALPALLALASPIATTVREKCSAAACCEQLLMDFRVGPQSCFCDQRGQADAVAHCGIAKHGSRVIPSLSHPVTMLLPFFDTYFKNVLDISTAHCAHARTGNDKLKSLPCSIRLFIQ